MEIAPSPAKTNVRTLRAEALLALLGVALVPAAIWATPKPHDAQPNTLASWVIIVLYVAFCALEARFIYLVLTKNERLKHITTRVITSLVLAFLIGFAQLLPMVVLLIVWPLWIVTLLALLVSSLVRLRLARRRQAQSEYLT